MVEAVVFDLDGVLVDSEPMWEEVRRDYVTEYGGHWHPEAQRTLMGMSTSEWARYLSGELGVDRPPKLVAAEVIERMAARYAGKVPLVPGAVAAVRRLAAQWPLGLASSSPPELIAAVLEAADLAALFSATVSTEEVPHGKPAPDVYRVVADRLRVATVRCVAVEDSTNGVRAAAAAGMLAIAVPRPAYPLEADAVELATAVVTDLADLTVTRITTLG